MGGGAWVSPGSHVSRSSRPLISILMQCEALRTTEVISNLCFSLTARCTPHQFEYCWLGPTSRAIKDVPASQVFPSRLYLNLVLGNVNVTLLSNQAK